MRTLLTALHSRRARRAAALFLSFALAHFALPLGVSAVNLDEGFGGDGFVTHDLGGTEEALAVAVQTDGKLVVLGEVMTSDGSAPEKTLLLRYGADGSTDAGFGVGGKTVVEFPGFIFSRQTSPSNPTAKSSWPEGPERTRRTPSSASGSRASTPTARPTRASARAASRSRTSSAIRPRAPSPSRPTAR